METTTSEVPRGIVLEALNEKNFTNWATCMKNYLMGKDLWGLVDKDAEPNFPKDPTEWREKNAKALHAIQVSCDSRMFSHVMMESSAEAAWNRLASITYLREHKIDSKDLADKNISAIEIISSGGSDSADNNISVTEIISSGGSDKDDSNISVHEIISLYKAVTAGDWEKTKGILKSPEAARVRISTDGDTALHVAVLHENEDLVEKLVDFMDKKDLELTRTGDGATALHLAATGRKVKMAQAIIRKNRRLLLLSNADDNVPVCVAALYGDRKMLDYLYSETPYEVLSTSTTDTQNNVTYEVLSTNATQNEVNHGARLLNIAVNAENYGFALKLLERFPNLAITKDVDGRLLFLNSLAQKLSSFPSEQSIWHRSMSKCFNFHKHISPNAKRIDVENPILEEYRNKDSCIGHTSNCVYEYKSKMKKRDQAMEILKQTCKQLDDNGSKFSTQELESLVTPAIIHATEAGNVGFIRAMFESYPALKKFGALLGRIFYIAVEQRQESIWKLVQELFPEKILNHFVVSLEDECGNNVLHMAAMLAPESLSRKVAVPAMQMQLELRSFKEIQNIVPTMLQEKVNREGKTPQTLFDEQHNLLAREGRQWMKNTATACLVVATLIATVMFEGANDTQNWDSKLISYWYTFHTYMVADALSLLFSTMSALTFLSIFTSARSTQEDLLVHLPFRFIIGMLTLFLSIGTMMLAFGILFYVNLSQSQYWSALGFSFLAIMPVFLFGALHFHLLVQMITYSTKFLYKP